MVAIHINRQLMSKEISFEERKKIQLEMLDEIDSFCKEHQIRYSIAFGTLLGAVRHKGFIPWDDDVDIMMPLPDLLKFKERFKSANIAYVDADNDPTHAYAFSRLAYKKSYNKEGLIFKAYGICIDLYVLVGISDVEQYFSGALPLFDKRKNMMKWRKRIITRLPVCSIPGFNHCIKKYRDYLFNHSCDYENAANYYIIAGPLSMRNRMTYDRDLFSKVIPMKFEDRSYPGIAEYDYFMKLRYGDYMQLPPEEQRHPYHGGHYYWK